MSKVQLNSFLDEVSGALGNESRVTNQRLQGIEDMLRPIFKAMPKNSLGNLDHASARYVLHRLFVQRHAMYMKGLDVAGGSWSDASASEVLQELVPDFVQSLFEERFHGQGLGMHELAVLAAILEHLIHKEAVQRLQISYDSLGLPQGGRLNEFVSAKVMDTYMSLFILGKNASSMSSEEVSSLVLSIPSSYPGWHDTQKFVQQVRSEVIAAKASESDFLDGDLTFKAVADIVEEIGERYGRWQDAECKDLKSALVKLEKKGTGRVLLKYFYGHALDGAWQFTESPEYLRELGALDESIPESPAVIIPNYINAHSNCLASSSIYSVCCINECEALLGHLEREIAAPEAYPEEILKIVAKLPSATVGAPRDLPADLRGRLEEIASHHDGTVPLHGRLFSQWLHHAYPRECPYPHVTGSTNPVTTGEWYKKSSAVSEAEMQRWSTADAPETLFMPWKLEEELVTKRTKPSKGW
eukprot:CAMPEP_0197660806 /NCGR_PEP_ID=MMETSP1338-20131121/51071_1 /TAXON_ID=43686 ORGANISM="Pelagodinium beii, Strain RCC1491" /NCGR_SAMPLE_ID=MMETSP1338 /ASSEMBLY_ACC=CAM_ASM_000754 /LENGTH=470 /DNA_ID=CAMNT_0043238237 /DNA_START=190 /DNA_END=1599 /DNA_ORIENTATION=+